jgi:RNA polymerase sigma-70 factor (ECF subfamily)
VLTLKSQQAFLNLYASQSGGVHRFVQGMVGGNFQVAEELTQESFLKAWKALPTFAFKSTLKTWVYSVALNTTRDWLRCHAGKTYAPLSPNLRERDLTETPETRAVKEALLELEEETRAILMLHYYEDLSLSQIASVVKIPEGTVKSRLHHAKAKLRPQLLSRGFDV